MAVKKFQSKDEIASWKIDSPVERWLAKKADSSEFWKRAYVDYYKYKDREYFINGVKLINKNIDIFVGEVTPSLYKKYRDDMVYSLHRFGCMFDEYFMFDFEHLNVLGKETFITDKKRWEYYNRMNSRENLDLFNDKKKAYDFFKSYYKRELILLKNPNDKDCFVSFASRHNVFIVKPYNGSGGKGISIYDINKFDNIDNLFELIISNGAVVCEELIVQSNEMAALHPESLNTVRIPTVRIKDDVVIFHPFLRIGCGKSVVDNATSGGIIAPVDSNTGIVITKGADEKGNTYIYQPDTGIIIPGFAIPRWHEAVTIVSKLAKMVEDNNYCGWDMALTENGWIMVEGNPRGQFVEQYVTHKGIRFELEKLLQV